MFRKISLGMLLACNGDKGGQEPLEATWHGDVGAVMSEHCSGCHDNADSVGAPYIFSNYENASLFAGVAAAETAAHRMPPWGALASDTCENEWGWLDDLSLSESEIELLQTWSDEGAPEGTGDGEAFPEFISGTSLSSVDLSMTMGSAWTTDPEDDDTLRCFELDPQIEGEAAWFSGFEIVPGNDAVNHHALLFTVPGNKDGSHDLDTYRDAYGENQSWECFGTASCSDDEDADCPGTLSNQVVGAWTPNAGAVEMPPESAIQVEPGDRFVLQIHYHPSQAGSEVDDSTRLDLQLYDGDPLYEASMNVVGLFDEGQEFDDGSAVIPAGEEAWSGSYTKQLPTAGIWSVLPHMHVVGTHMRVEINRQSGNDECLADIPIWNYNWQRIYRMDSIYQSESLSLESGPTVQSGDTATVTCTFNNSPSNEQLVEAYENEGYVDDNGDVLIDDVPIGDGTTEEMCVAVIGLLQPVE